MTVKKLKEELKFVANNAELVYFPDGVLDEDGKKMLPGLGYFDPEQHQFVYIGKINTMEPIE